MGDPALEFNPFTGTLDWVAQPDAVSDPGEFTVPAGTVVGDLVYPSGNLAMTQADNSSVATQAVALIVEKPTSTTATLLFMGRVKGFAGLSFADELFLGSSGAFVTSSGLPTAADSIIQKVGQAVDTTTIIFNPQIAVVL